MLLSRGKYWAPFLFGLTLSCLLVLWGLAEVARVRVERGKTRSAAAKAALELTRAGVDALAASGAGMPELKAFLREAVSSSDISAAWVIGGGRSLASFGGAAMPPVELPPAMPPGAYYSPRLCGAWMPLRSPGMSGTGLVILMEQPGHGEPPDWSLAWIMAAGFGGILILVLAWSYSLRNRDLEAMLKERRDRDDGIEELSLAAAGLAHETKNPLGVIRGLAQRIASSDDLAPEKVRAMASDIMQEADVTADRLGRFMCYAKVRDPEMAALDAREAIGRVARILSGEFAAVGVALEADIPALEILADAEMLSQILTNLLMNSLQATGPGGRVSVGLEPESSKTLRLVVADNGAGIPKDIMPRLFKPYVSGKKRGHGIGLAIVGKMVAKSGWLINVESEPGKGTRVAVGGIKTSGRRHA